MRLIDADALFVDASFFNDELDRAERFYSEEQIKDAPTVDAVEVVRCKDCENWDGEEHWCNIRDSYGWDYKPNDFCSYGDKKGKTMRWYSDGEREGE